MKKLILTLFTSLLITSCSFNDSAKNDSDLNLTQTHCPISGKKVDEWAYTDRQEQRIYFCTLECAPEFLNTPDKYLTQMKTQGVSPAKIQTRCPVTDEAVTTANDFYKSREGEVAICCKKCLRKITKFPIPYLMKLKKQGVTIGVIAQESSDPHAGHDHSKHGHHH